MTAVIITLVVLRVAVAAWVDGRNRVEKKPIPIPVRAHRKK